MRSRKSLAADGWQNQRYQILEMAVKLKVGSFFKSHGFVGVMKLAGNLAGISLKNSALFGLVI